eukprot:1230954-Pleurochrysis_carterae.AAC.1
MPCKWDHPVATLPVTNGTIRHTRRMTEILRIKLRAFACIGRLSIRHDDAVFTVQIKGWRMVRA